MEFSECKSSRLAFKEGGRLNGFNKKIMCTFYLVCLSGQKDINHTQYINHIISCFRSFNHHFVTLLISLTHFLCKTVNTWNMPSYHLTIRKKLHYTKEKFHEKNQVLNKLLNSTITFTFSFDQLPLYRMELHGIIILTCIR